MVGSAADSPRRLGQTPEMADVRAGSIDIPARASLDRRTTQVRINPLLPIKMAVR